MSRAAAATIVAALVCAAHAQGLQVSWRSATCSADGARCAGAGSWWNETSRMWTNGMMVTVDAATSWTLVAVLDGSPGSNLSYTSVAASADGKALFVATATALYVSTNANWTAFRTLLKTGVFAIASSGDGFSLAIVSYSGTYPYGAVSTSEDGGNTWTLSANGSFLGVSRSGATVVAVSTANAMIVSMDGGATWGAPQLQGKVSRAVLSGDGGRLVAIGVVGSQQPPQVIYSSTPPFVLVAATPVELDNNTWLGLAAVPGNGSRAMVFVTNARLAFASAEFGSWKPLALPISLTSVGASADGMTLVGCASGSNIYRSTDGGVTWEVTASPFPNDGASPPSSPPSPPQLQQK